MSPGDRTHAEGLWRGLAGKFERVGENKIHVFFRNPRLPVELQVGEESSPRAPSDDIQLGDPGLDRRVIFLAKYAKLSQYYKNQHSKRPNPWFELLCKVVALA